jgi:hypothetical protein
LTHADPRRDDGAENSADRYHDENERVLQQRDHASLFAGRLTEVSPADA